MDENWINEIPVAVDDNPNVKINNVKQKQLLHYVPRQLFKQRYKRNYTKIMERKDIQFGVESTTQMVLSF